MHPNMNKRSRATGRERLFIVKRSEIRQMTTGSISSFTP